MTTPEQDNEELIEEMIRQSRMESEKRSRKHLWYTLIPFLFGILWLIFSYMQVRKLDDQVDKLNESLEAARVKLTQYEDSIRHEKHTLGLFKYLRENLQIEYLHFLQNDLDIEGEEYQRLQQSMKAGELLIDMLKERQIQQDIELRYHIKNRDAERVKYAINELGYPNFEVKETVNVAVSEGETNAVVIGDNIRLYDVKVISLALIRAGFDVQYIYRSIHNPELTNLVQIVRAQPTDGSLPPDPYPPEEISDAKSLDDLLVDFPI